MNNKDRFTLAAIIIGFMSVIFMACGSYKDDTGKEVHRGLNIMTIEGCKYVIYVGYESCAMVHAGNCHNPEHQAR